MRYFAIAAILAVLSACAYAEPLAQVTDFPKRNLRDMTASRDEIEDKIRIISKDFPFLGEFLNDTLLRHNITSREELLKDLPEIITELGGLGRVWKSIIDGYNYVRQGFKDAMESLRHFTCIH